MSKLPPPIHSITAKVDAHHEAEQAKKPAIRGHYGLSQAAHHCERWLWLNFRNCITDNFPGRILRLFRRGHHEERWVVEDLRAIGMDISNAGEYNQKRVEFGSMVSGSLDGIINYGVPEAPKTKHVLEIKTHSEKSFNDLVKKAVKESKPIHYGQMQVYMLGSKIDRALYVAICKNDDRMYTERVKLDKEFAQKLVDRSKRIATSDRLPPPISTDPSWYQCKMCAAHDFCHKSKTLKPEKVNCRNCAHSTVDDHFFYCEKYQTHIDLEHSLKAWPCHVLNPDLVPYQMSWDESLGEWSVWWDIDGKKVANGENGFTSQEILSNPEACANEDDTMKEIRKRLGAEVVG